MYYIKCSFLIPKILFTVIFNDNVSHNDDVIIISQEPIFN